MRRYAVLSLLTLSCGGDGTKTTGIMPGGDQATQSIAESGGTVTTPDGASVSLPAGAVTSATSISISQDSAPTSLPGSTSVGTQYTLGPTGTSFAQPVTVTLAVDLTALPSGFTIDDVFVVRIDGDKVVALGATVVDSGHVSFETSNFSDVDVVVAVPTSDQTPSGCYEEKDCATDADSGTTSAPQYAAGLCDAAFTYSNATGMYPTDQCKQISDLATPGSPVYSCPACGVASVDASAP